MQAAFTFRGNQVTKFHRRYNVDYKVVERNKNLKNEQEEQKFTMLL